MNNVLYSNSADGSVEAIDYSLVGVVPPYVPLQKEYTVQGKHIVGVFGDRGGLNAVWPVLEIALSMDVKVTLYLVATCKQQYESGSLKFQGVFADMTIHPGQADDDAIYEFFHHITTDLLIIGASHSKEGVNAARAALMRWNHRVILVEDMYGSARDILNSSTGLSISKLCVIDEYAKMQMVATYPTTKDRIVVTGGPQFDATIDVKRAWKERRSLLRERMGVNDSHQVYLIAGGLNGTAGILELLEQGLKDTGLANTARFIVRQHPRATDEDKAKVQGFVEARPQTLFTDVGRDLAPTTNDLLPGVDYVLSGYSTTNHFGILYEMRGVIYVGTPELIADHEREKGAPRPPEVEAGAAWYVQTPEQMKYAIQSTFFKKSVSDTCLQMRAIMAAQHRMAEYNDSYATNRVWGQIRQLLST